MLGWCQVGDIVRSRTCCPPRSEYASEYYFVDKRHSLHSHCQYFLREEDIGKPRAAAMLPRISELNAYVPVRNLGGEAGQEITVDLIRPFQVCMTLSIFVWVPVITISRLLCSVTCLTKNNWKSMTGRINTMSTLLLQKREGFLGRSQVSCHSGNFTDGLKLRVQRFRTQVHLCGSYW